MPQLFFSVERPVADELARRAAIENLPLSQYLARIVREQVQTDWPDGYLSSVVGVGAPRIHCRSQATSRRMRSPCIRRRTAHEVAAGVGEFSRIIGLRVEDWERL